MKTGKQYILPILLTFMMLQSFCQQPLEILKITSDSLSRIKILGYEGSLSQYTKSKQSPVANKGNVVMERSPDNPTEISFIVSCDTLELIYDGRYAFEVKHNAKTVNQLNPLKLKEKQMAYLANIDLFSLYASKSKFLEGRKISQDQRYWILNFKIGQDNDLAKIWIDKITMLPEIILKEKSQGYGTLIKINNLQINKANLPKPGSQIVKYIDSYTLLPIGDIGITQFKDSRDSLVGKPAPVFSLTDLSGNKVNLSDFKGKVVLLDFWEVWCGPCRMSMPHLEELYKQYHPKGLEIIGLSKDNPAFAKKVLSDKKVTYINIMADDKSKLDYRVLEIPQYYLINRDGIIVYASKNGFEQKIEEIIRKVLD